MSGAGLFLDIVTIMSGVLMLCVALTILYNKCPDIVDEFNALFGRNTNSEAERRQAHISRILQDIEASKQASESKQQSACETPPEIKRAVTVESLDSRDDCVEVKELQNQADVDEYVAKYMQRGKEICQSPAESCSVYMDNTVVERLVPSSPAVHTPTHPKVKLLNMTPTIHEEMAADGLCMDYSMDTMDNVENNNNFQKKDESYAKHESFSSFAKPDYAMSEMDSPATTLPCGEACNYPFSFMSKYYNVGIAPSDDGFDTDKEGSLRMAAVYDSDLRSEMSEEEDRSRVNHYSDEQNDEDASYKGSGGKSTQSETSSEMAKSNKSKVVPTALAKTALAKTPSSTISYSRTTRTPGIKQTRNDPPTSMGSKSTIDTSSSIPLDHSGAPTTIASSMHSRRMEDSTLDPASKDSFSPLKRRNVTFSSQLLDESSLEYSKEVATKADTLQRKPKITIVTNKSVLDLDDEQGLAADQEIPDLEREITPYTASTADMWSPSASLTPQTCDQDLESVSTFGYSMPSDESPYGQKGFDFPTDQDVHVCKSASCTACRVRNTPTFISTTKPTTGENYSLARPLPSRWWDHQQAKNYGQLKQLVSSVLLRGQDALNRSLEEHPFDEA